MPTLICKRVQFLSQRDEAMFFGFLKGIRAVRRIRGVGDELLFDVPVKVTDSTLRDLLALFYRYRVSMQQLAQFETADNREWFRGRSKYWHRRVFGKPVAVA